MRARPHAPSVLEQRASGLLLHPTSLPGPHGSGDVGPAAHRFVDLLQQASQRWWQMLPVGPVGYGSSPYSAHSAFAGSPLLVALEPLVAEGLVAAADVRPPPLPEGRVDYGATGAFRESVRRRAFEAFLRRPAKERRALDAFAEAQDAWLEDWVLYRALKRAHGESSWAAWPAPLRDRKPAALLEARKELDAELAFHRFDQWLFERQWRALRAHCEARGVLLLGDLPIFVAHDSADVWANRELFFLDRAGHPTVIAGVPPDYFSATGQRWGNPLYRWPVLEKRRYGFWVERMRRTLSLFDAVRLDHFIGFTRYWEIPAHEPTAQGGRWVKGPGEKLFLGLEKALGKLPLVAEDLGAVTDEVLALRDRFGFPGLKILQFAFGTDPQAPSFKPHNYPRGAVVYTGTHDNDTAMGWFTDPGGGASPRSREQVDRERRYALAYLGSSGREFHWDMIRAALASVATLAIVPVQDVLGLGNEARMNRPGVATGNWEWRLREGAFGGVAVRRLTELTRLYDRWVPRKP